MTLRAVIFDMDGTLLDTETLAIRAGLKTIDDLNLPPHEHVLHDLVGRAGPEVVDILQSGFGTHLDVDLYFTTWDTNFEAALAEGIDPKPGAHNLLSHLSDINIPFALGTNAQSPYAARNIARAGLGDFFPTTHIFGSDRAARPKPAPDVFLAAADHLQTAPEHCIVFEDSEVGTQAALAAGMTVVQVPDQRPAATRDAHHLADNLLHGAKLAGLI